MGTCSCGNDRRQGELCRISEGAASAGRACATDLDAPAARAAASAAAAEADAWLGTRRGRGAGCRTACSLCLVLHRAAALRHVAHALLVGVAAKQASPAALPAETGAAVQHDGSVVVPALAYLRDRVCVPRDLRLPAARQFRAHLNWAIDTLAASS